MASARNIRRRIKSIANIAKITKAMQMVASSKMRRAQETALAGRPYAKLLVEFVTQTTKHAGDFTHPLSEIRPLKTHGVIVIGPDRGLCGALPANIVREALKFDPQNTVYIVVGKKPAQYLSRLGRKLIAEFAVKDTPQYGDAKTVSQFAQRLFLNRELDRVDVVFTQFINTLVQRAITLPFLPIGTLEKLTLGERFSDSSHTSQARSADYSTTTYEIAEYLFEPDAPQIFEALIPHYLDYLMFQIFLEAKASEHSARMVAMKNATDNANQLIQEMTLHYNKMRQASITKELLDITSAQMAME